MSFLAEVIGELLGALLEGPLGSGKPEPHFPEGTLNASMGAAAGAMAFLSLLLGLPAVIFAVSYIDVRGLGSLLIFGLGAASALLALGTIRVGNRALVVTKRNATLSHMSRAVGYFVLTTSVVSSILGAIGMFRWLA